MYRFITRNAPLPPFVLSDFFTLADRPRLTSFFNRAFNACRRTANDVANTQYLQSMHNGTLDPLSYGCLTVQDAYYCYHAQDTLRVAMERVDREAHPDLYELLEAKVASYDNYNKTFLEDWHIRNTESVIPTETMRRYVEHEQRVAREEDPIYALVAYLPCYNLWPWFARKLMLSPCYNPGVYQGWFEAVYQGEKESFGGAWLMGNFIEEWKDAGHPFDEGLALDIYKASMEFELGVFSEACG